MRRGSPSGAGITDPTEPSLGVLDPAGSAADARRLFLLSFLLLFTELALIRWTGANILYLSYFSNFVLLGSFLGTGLGFVWAGREPSLFRAAPVALLLLLLFVEVFPVEIDRGPGSQLIYFGSYGRSGLPAWVTLPVIFVAVAATTATIADGLGRLFGRFAPLTAYRLDLLGSLAGILAFSLVSFLGTPPIVWGIVVTVCLLVLGGRRVGAVRILALVGIVLVLGAESLASSTRWSPYYEIELQPEGERTVVAVNGVPHQVIEPTRIRRRFEPLYFRAYELLRKPPEDVLIVGAGTGGDAAIALSEGADHVDAVEIDPRLAELGRERNPERPYEDVRVNVVIDDGRAFLERARTKYDLILFALPDSLTLVSGQSSLRLESYLFTREAFEAVRDHLRSDGTFAVYNYFRERWLVDRFGGLLESVFGRRPCLDRAQEQGGFALLTVGRSDGSIDCGSVWSPRTESTPASTDDRPFPYLRAPGIPAYYVAALTFILLGSVVAIRVVAGPFRGMRPYLDLFLMGAAFLLLETMNVVRFALLFGTTWFVNALVFAGILLTVLAAVEVARRLRPKRPARLYVFLFLALAAAWVVPLDALLGVRLPLRFVAATLLAFAPIFVANLIFAERFRRTATSTIAFGVNILGAMLGGVLEYLSLAVGHRNLLVLAGGLYALAYVAGRRELVPDAGGDLSRGRVASS